MDALPVGQDTLLGKRDKLRAIRAPDRDSHPEAFQKILCVRDGTCDGKLRVRQKVRQFQIQGLFQRTVPFRVIDIHGDRPVPVHGGSPDILESKVQIQLIVDKIDCGLEPGQINAVADIPKDHLAAVGLLLRCIRTGNYAAGCV